MGIDLSGTDVAVPEHRLHASDICPIHKEVSGKTVAHSVRTYVLGNARQLGVFANKPLDATRSKPTVRARGVGNIIATVVQKEGYK